MKDLEFATDDLGEEYITFFVQADKAKTDTSSAGGGAFGSMLMGTEGAVTC